jgi:hypothetical protein
MRMAPDHFLRDRVNDPAEIKESFFLGDPRLKNDLEQEIAQFLLQIPHISARNGICDHRLPRL